MAASTSGKTAERTDPGHGAAVDAAVEKLAANRDTWRNLPAERKLELLYELRDRAIEHGPDWALASARVRGVEPGGPAGHVVGLAWYIGLGMFGATLRALIETYEQFLATRSFPPPTAVRKRPDGQFVVTVYPRDKQDEVAFQDWRSEIWIEPGKPVSQGAAWEQPGAVVAALGGGNFECAWEAMTKIFGELKVCIYKPNPVNASAFEVVERVLQPLVDAGCLAFAHPDAGPELIAHEGVDELIMTGSCTTYDRIVWGPDGEQAKAKKAGKKRTDKPFDAELGGVSPWVVVPGRWTDKQLDHHAAQIVSAKSINLGAVCASPQLIVVDRDWPQREQFLERVRHHLHQLMPTPGYYPGSRERRDAFRAEYPDAVEVGPDERALDSQLDVLFITDADPHSTVTQREAFGPVLAEVALDGGGDAGAFLDRAVAYCNDEIFGSLSMTLLIHPDTQTALGEARVEQAVADLEFGSVGINTWTTFVAASGALPWGAFPKHGPEDIQSGTGWVHNLHLYDHPQKVVVWSPFTSPVHPPMPTPNEELVIARSAMWQVTRRWPDLIRMIRAALVKF